MSVKVMGAVLDLALAVNRKMVLVVLGNYADDSGRNVFPSIKTLAEKTGVGARTVERIMGEFREHGVVIRYDWRTGKRGRIPVYRVDVKRAAAVYGLTGDNHARVAVSQPNSEDGGRKPDGSKDARAAGSRFGNPASGNRLPATGDAIPRQSLAENPSRSVTGNRESVSRKKRARIAPDWKPSGELLDWARGYAREKDVDWIDWWGEAEQFRDHHLKVGSTMADWDAAWRTWARNAVNWGGERRRRSGPRQGDIAQAFERMDQAVKGSVP